MLKQQVNNDYFLSCFYCTLSLTLESQKDPAALFDEIFQVFSANISKFKTAPPRLMRRQELLKTKSGEFEMVLSLKVSVLVALVESPSNIARIFQAQQLSCCGFIHDKHPMSRGICSAAILITMYYLKVSTKIESMNLLQTGKYVQHHI